ncbi:hypothetical protein ACFX2I_037768 [Malus domestica]
MHPPSIIIFCTCKLCTNRAASLAAIASANNGEEIPAMFFAKAATKDISNDYAHSSHASLFIPSTIKIALHPPLLR